MSEPLIAPSILAADFANIERDVKMINQSKADYIHIDIMDGRFVPNISFGFPVTRAIQRHSQIPLDFHLMIEDADPYLGHCKDSGAKIISVHMEACRHLHRTLGAIRDLDIKAGIAINPHTAVSSLDSILEYADVVLVMSVNPGFGGQSFIENTYDKVRRIREMAGKKNKELIISIDGGVNSDNAPGLTSAGADMLIAGNFVFKSKDPIATINSLKSS